MCASALKTQYEDVAPYSKAVEMLPYLHDFILVGSLISESPLERRDIISTPSIEKLLVDRATGKQIDLVVDSTVKDFAKESINKDKVLFYERAVPG